MASQKYNAMVGRAGLHVPVFGDGKAPNLGRAKPYRAVSA